MGQRRAPPVVLRCCADRPGAEAASGQQLTHRVQLAARVEFEQPSLHAGDAVTREVLPYRLQPTDRADRSVELLHRLQAFDRPARTLVDHQADTQIRQAQLALRQRLGDGLAAALPFFPAQRHVGRAVRISSAGMRQHPGHLDIPARTQSQRALRRRCLAAQRAVEQLGQQTFVGVAAACERSMAHRFGLGVRLEPVLRLGGEFQPCKDVVGIEANPMGPTEQLASACLGAGQATTSFERHRIDRRVLRADREPGQAIGASARFSAARACADQQRGSTHPVVAVAKHQRIDAVKLGAALARRQAWQPVRVVSRCRHHAGAADLRFDLLVQRCACAGHGNRQRCCRLRLGHRFDRPSRGQQRQPPAHWHWRGRRDLGRHG